MILGRATSQNAAEALNSDESLGAIECGQCGTVGIEKSCACRVAPRPALLPVVLAGKIDVVRRLGHGGMGVVYLGRDRRLHRDVALKTLPRAAGVSVDVMLQEAAAMARVEHQNLASIYDMEMWHGTPVLVVEYLSGGTLHDRLGASGPLTPIRAFDIGVELARGLDALHEQNVLHRDIKPSNVGFSRAGVPKLLDFGIAKLIDRVDDGSRVDLAGTPLYLSPELWGGAQPHKADDLWALSLVVLQAMTGVHPFAGRTLAEVRRRMLGRPCTLLADQTLQQWFFMRALHPDRGRRPQSAMELIAAFNEHMAQRPA
jgi:serine/threonine protein kinase